jgi:4-amino-4-deoxy-L-arabinose transferase-like glycosyltransferase
VRILRHPLPWILLAAAALRVSAAGYARGSDDLNYARAARDLLQGTYDPGSHFHAARLGVVAPTALAFAVSGVNYAASIAWPLASSVLTVALLYAAARRASGPGVAAAAALFLAAGTQHVISGAELFPDAPLTLWSLLSLWLYARASAGDGGARAYALSGLCFFLAWATRAEALRLLPLFAAAEALAVRRRGFDRRALAFAAAAAGGMAAEGVLFGLVAGDPGVRLRELFPALEGWSESPAARGPAVGRMLKSLVSPFGAFGIFFLLAGPGAALAVREGRLRGEAAAAGYVLATSLLLAARYRLSDGRFYALLSPLAAWFAAELLFRIPRAAWRRGAVAAAFLAGVTLLHARLPFATIRAYERLAERLPRDGGPVYADPRTRGVLALYFGRADVLDFGGERPCWVVRNELAQGIDRALYGRDAGPPLTGPPAWSTPLEVGGVPGFRQAAAPLVRLRSGPPPRLELYRLDR